MLRQRLDALVLSTKDMPNRMRQYAAFEYVQDVLKVHVKANTIISELKSEALKERHWRQLFKVLKLPAQISLTQFVRCSQACVFRPDASLQTDFGSSLRPRFEEERDVDQGRDHSSARRDGLGRVFERCMPIIIPKLQGGSLMPFHIGSRNVDDLYIGSRELPEQMSSYSVSKSLIRRTSH